MAVILLCGCTLALLLSLARRSWGAPRTIAPEGLERLEANCIRYESARELRETLVSTPDARLIEATDAWLIDFVPDPDVKRSLFVHEGDVIHGCPVHRGGRYVFAKTADPFLPDRLTCSIGGETYPNADFPESGTAAGARENQGWLDTRKQVDGLPNPTYGLKYYFHAHYAYWGRWMVLSGFMEELAVAHLLAAENDPRKQRAGRAAAVLLLRLANVFPTLKREDFASYDRVGTAFPHSIKITDYVFEPRHTNAYATAFDLVRDYILSDPSLLRLDYKKAGTAWGDDPGNDYDGDGQVTTADLVACVEQDLLRDYGGMYASIPPKYANATMLHLETLSLLAVVLDEPEYYGYARETLETIGTNWFTNDGAYFEGAIPGYGQLGILALRQAFGWLSRFDPELFSPRVVKGLLFGPSMVCLDAVLPNTDDASSGGFSKIGKAIDFGLETYQRAYLDYGDRRLLHPLRMMCGMPVETPFDSRGALLGGTTEEEAIRLREGLAATADAPRASSLERSGYAVLRGGEKTEPFDLFVTFDGYGGSHTHFDTFNPILYGYGYALVPDIGYPDNLKDPARDNWVNHTLAHWTVTVDRKRIDSGFERARLKLFVDRPGFRAFTAESPSSYGGLASEYRRTLCLVDIPGGGTVVVDFFRVAGGEEHLYSFHGAAADGSRSVDLIGGMLGAPSPFETLQGAWHDRHVPYGRPLEGGDDRCLAYLTEIREAKADAGAAALKFTLPRGDEQETELDLWMPAACADAFVVAEGPTSPTVPQRNTPLPFVIARSGQMGSGERRESLFTAVIEPRQGRGRISGVGPDSEEGEVTIELVDGGRLLLRTGLEGVACAFIGADGHTSREVGASLESVGKVGRPDRKGRTVGFQGTRAVSEGDLLIFENDLRRNTFYEVEEVGPKGQVTVGDRWTDLRVATGFLTGRSDGSRLEYDKTFIIQQPIRAQCRGARVVNEEGDELRVVQVDNDTILLDASVEACASFPVDANGDGRMAFDIYDFGEGDSVARARARDSLCSRDLDQGGRSV